MKLGQTKLLLRAKLKSASVAQISVTNLRTGEISILEWDFSEDAVQLSDAAEELNAECVEEDSSNGD